MADAARQHPRMTVEEFVNWPGEFGVKYELIDGVPVAMNPPKTFHGAIVASAAALLGLRLRGRRPCRGLADAGVWITEEDYYVADLAVTCSPVKNTDRVHEPSLLVEVLSKSTRTEDLGRKIPAYKEVASVREVWAVDSERRSVQVWRREGPRWIEEPRFVGRSSFESEVLGGAVALDDLYETTDL
jgi:Uma2 family endonuclease